MFAKVINPNSPYYQQGDCLVKKCGVDVFVKNYPSIPSDAKPTKSPLVLKGQTNNHALYDGEFEVLESNGTLFVRVTKECILDHVKDLNSMSRAEHHAMLIAPGEYFIDQVTEFDHLTEEKRKIVD